MGIPATRIPWKVNDVFGNLPWKFPGNSLEVPWEFLVAGAWRRRPGKLAANLHISRQQQASWGQCGSQEQKGTTEVRWRRNPRSSLGQ